MTHPFDYAGQIHDREKMIAILEARIDCHAGPGTATPACGACVSCLLRVIETLEREKAALTTRVSVLDGSACAEERAEGNGGCENDVAELERRLKWHSERALYLLMAREPENAEKMWRALNTLITQYHCRVAYLHGLRDAAQLKRKT